MFFKLDSFEKDIYICKNNKEFDEKYSNKKITVNIFSRNIKFLSFVGSINLINKINPDTKEKINKKYLYKKKDKFKSNEEFKKCFPSITCDLKDIRKPKFINYIWNKKKFNGITIYIDKNISDVMNCTSKYNIAVLAECKYINSKIYKLINKYEDKFDLIFTHCYDIYEKYPDKTIFIAGSACVLDLSQIGIFEKSKLISFPISNKLTGKTGYILRKNIKDKIISKQFKKNIDTFGTGFNKPFISKSICLKDYRFSICVENSKQDYYFTEKVLDVILSGCVPIYWGCPNIENIFNIKGILVFNTIEELAQIINNITNTTYTEMKPYIEENFNIAKKYIDWDDNLIKIIHNRLNINYLLE